jgi:hypothetical protein
VFGSRAKYEGNDVKKNTRNYDTSLYVSFVISETKRGVRVSIFFFFFLKKKKAKLSNI